jgi:hypothetical protein
LLISLFVAFYNDMMFPDTGKAVVTVLERLGHTVEFRAFQTCCGQMHYNTGYHEDGMRLMVHFLKVFRGAEVICVPSSSCVAHFFANQQFCISLRGFCAVSVVYRDELNSLRCSCPLQTGRHFLRKLGVLSLCRISQPMQFVRFQGRTQDW